MALITTPHITVGRAVRFLNNAPLGGDAAFVAPLPDGLFVAIIDVLGHGATADFVRTDIERFLGENADRDLALVISSLDRFLQGTVGAAAGLCHIREATGEVSYTGVGNTVARRFGEADTRLVSRDGVLGQISPRPRIENLRLSDGDTLVLYTDGVRTHFEIDEYPRLLSDDAQRIADTILESFGKAHDDAACVVAKFQR
jgi:phosphoserine phosphatase RsbX